MINQMEEFKGKALEMFFFNSLLNKNDLKLKETLVYHSLAINFFDDANIFISVMYDSNTAMFYCTVKHEANVHTTPECFNRKDAVSKAITIAVTIYNLKNK